MSGLAAAGQPVAGSAKPKARKPPGRRKALARVAAPSESSEDMLDMDKAGAASPGALLSPEPADDQGMPLHANSSAGRHLAASQGAGSEHHWMAPAEDAWCYIASSPKPPSVHGSPQPGALPLSTQQQFPAGLAGGAGDASKATPHVCSMKKVSVAHMQGMPVIAAKDLGTHRLLVS